VGTTTLKVSAPGHQYPVSNQKPDRLPVVLQATPAVAQFGGTDTLFYRFQVFDAAGTLLEDSGTVGGLNWGVTAALADSAPHRWRVRAESGPFVGPWSSMADFLAPNPRPCGPPLRLDPLSIITCHISEYERTYGGIHGYLDLFLLDVAIDLNRAGVPGGPYGRLRKTSGNNCNGWSCDIICAGQGGGQRQHDILVDERFARWGAPIDDIRADTCVVP
jgi:hypothetical protein